MSDLEKGNLLLIRSNFFAECVNLTYEIEGDKIFEKLEHNPNVKRILVRVMNDFYKILSILV